MPIGFQPSHKAELRVEVGKTNVEELQKFQQDVQAKGGGEIRARKNDDGSCTLYVAADKKVRLRNVFGQSYGAEARAGKVDLARTLMKEIISRRLPERPGGENRELLSRLDQRSSSRVLGDVLSDVSRASQESFKSMYDTMPPKLQEHYQQLDVIMTTPGLKEAFGSSMKDQFVKENFDFLSLVQQYDKTTSPHEKLQLAEQIYKMVESSENPPDQRAGYAHSDKPIQINLSSAMAGRITDDIQHLRQAIVPGREPTETDKQRLNNLFSESRGEITKLSKAAVNVFTGSDSFKAEAARAHTAKLQRPDTSNPASHLKPGSGEAFNAQVKHLTNVGNLMGDPEVRAAYKEHLAGSPQSANFDHYEQVENLVQLAKRGDISDAELLQHCQTLFVDSVPEGQRDTPFFEMVSSRLQGLHDERELLGGDVESRQQQEALFGRERPGEDSLVRGKLTEFLQDMQADAANGLKGDKLKSFESGPLSKLVSTRMFNADLDWRPENESHVGTFERFAGKELEGSGGATGSGRAKVGPQFFQVKGSISHAGLGRQLKAGGLNTENYGEVISSNIARSLLPKADRGLVPEVALRQDVANHEAMVTSKYLAGGKGDLKGLYIELAGPLPPGQKHPRIQLDAPDGARSGDGVLRLSGQASRDVQRNLALSALMGDHDVNPGNMIALKDGRVGRIDFGHAFNELISAPGGKLTGGGGVRNKDNRVLDFFNRESVSGNPFVRGSNTPKVWRDYIGPGPSEGMTQALRDIAGSPDALEGIVQAKSQFTDLIAQLETEGTPEARKQIKDLTQSLARIATNIEKPITATEPGEIVKQVFNTIEAFVLEGQAQMREVADLSELQTKIDTFISSTRDNPGAPIPDDIQQIYTRLTGSSVKLSDGPGLNWMKHTDGTPAFQGDLTAFLQTRRAELGGT